MRVVTQSEYRASHVRFNRELKECVFIYPTDTIYGIGCNALNGALIDKIRELKGRPEIPFSVIAPSKEWIREHCIVDVKGEEWLEKLPGPYTLIFKMKSIEDWPHALTKGRDTIGVRIPDHWISNMVASLKYPIVTTSANILGGNTIARLEDIPSEWKNDVTFCFFEGEITGNPSTLVHLYEEDVKVQERA